MNKHNIYSANYEAHSLVFKLILFVLYPFGAFLFSLRDMASKSSYAIFFLFGIVFCWHMNPTSRIYTDDLYGIMERVINTNITTPQLLEQVTAFFTFSEDSPKELYENILIWFSKLFTNNPHSFFAIASIPFLFFFLKSFKFLTSNKNFDNQLYCLLVVLFFILPRDIITVQNPRFATGVWMAIFATLSYFYAPQYRKIMSLFWIFITPLIHSSFWFYVVVFFIGLMVPKKQKLFFILLYATIPFSYFSYDLLHGMNFSFLPTSIQSWTYRYLSEESFDKFVEHVGASGFFWISELFSFFQKTVYAIIPYYIWTQKNEFREQERLNTFVSFYFLFYAIVNFIQFVPVLGERFYWLVRIFSIFLWFYIVFPRHKKFLFLLLFACSWEIFRRYLYNGAMERCVPNNIFYSPLITLISDFWGKTGIWN